MTVVPGCVKHRANAIDPTRYVLPTCRHNDIATMLQAYNPDESFDKISRPRSSCHSSNNHPRLLHVSRTRGQPVDTAPSGVTRCFARSAKRVIGGVSHHSHRLVLSHLSSRNQRPQLPH